MDSYSVLLETNKQLESENKSLKEDLERAMSGTVNSVKSTDRKRSKDWSESFQIFSLSVVVSYE